MVNNQSNPGRAFGRSGRSVRGNKRDRTDCLSDRRSGCLSDEGINFFFPPKSGSAQSGDS